MKRRILFITSTNLASNPRCRKEIDLALKLNYAVSYIAFALPNWTIEKEAQIQIELADVEKIYIFAGRENLLSWITSTGVERFLRKFRNHISAVRLISFAVSKRSLQLMWGLKRLKGKPDFIIAHNPAAFYPAYYYSNKVNIPFAIDIEDYHPGEGNNKVVSKLSMQLIKKVLPLAEYVSFSAPLIQRKVVIKDLGNQVRKFFTTNNVFPQEEFQVPNESSNLSKIKMVWFSQNIDEGRGLEEILPVIDSLQDFFDITLIGNVKDTFFKLYLQNKAFIHLVPPLNQSELNRSLAQYDIGLAIEVSNVDENRNLCLTNKIWSYFQAGLFIIASNTKAQQHFLKTFPTHGVIIDLKNKNQIKDELFNIRMQIKNLNNQKKQRFENAKGQSWEIESGKLKREWQVIAGK